MSRDVELATPLFFLSSLGFLRLLLVTELLFTARTYPGPSTRRAPSYSHRSSLTLTRVARVLQSWSRPRSATVVFNGR
eukprot:6833830-Alexandrium_andersonii.AAC.1